MERLRFLPVPFVPPPPPPVPPLLLDYHLIPPPPPPPPLPRFEELMVTEVNGAYHGRDIFASLSTHQMDFWAMTGETVTSFLNIVEDIRPVFEGGFGHPCLLSLENRLLLTYVWLKKYPDFVTLSTLFDINGTSVSRLIHRMVDVLWGYFQEGIQWLTDEEWGRLRGNWASIPDAVGAIDGTVHTIEMPEEDSHLFYSGHARRYCISTQVIIDNMNTIRYIHVSILRLFNLIF